MIARASLRSLFGRSIGFVSVALTIAGQWVTVSINGEHTQHPLMVDMVTIDAPIISNQALEVRMCARCVRLRVCVDATDLKRRK